METSKATILFILHLPPPVHGAAMMGKYIHDSQLVNDSFDCHYINLTTATSLEDIGKGGLKKSMCFVRLLWRIRKAVRQLKPDLVYVTPNATAPAFYKDYIVVQMLKRMGCSVVAHYHNKGVSRKQDKWLDDRLYRRFFKDLKVILLAEALYQDVEKYVTREDVLICPNGIPETLGHEPAVKQHNDIPHLLFLSNLLESKGVLVLLDACKLLADKGYSFVCDVVGGETAEIDSTRFEDEVTQRGLTDCVCYHGKKYGRDKEQFWQTADVFVLPTANECFPLVLLEAMQHGVAVLSTDEGGIPAIIKNGENGYMVEKNNPQALADKLSYMLTHIETTREMGKGGYQKYQRYFTIQAFEQKLVACLSSVVYGVGNLR